VGRLGRSHGCPALRPAIARTVIDTIKDGSLLFAYYPDKRWLRGSRFLNGCS
jgi:L,D-transpeptidase catalytic domain